MKRIIFTLLSFLCVVIVSCVKNPIKEQSPEINNENLAAYNNLSTVSALDVPVRDGKITVVTFNGDTLCLTKTPTTITVPKTVSGTKAGGGIDISYVDAADPKYAEALGTGNTATELWQTLAFEDSMAGDYDYNDIVLHLCYQLASSKFHIGIHPIAYGATKNIALGLAVYYGNNKVADQIITQDSKHELFRDNNGDYCGIQGMINTSSFDYYCNFYTKVITLDAAGVHSGDIKVIWYIRIDGNRMLYAVNNKYNFLNEQKRPYGLMITNTGKTWNVGGNIMENSSSWFEYPKEGSNISACYPDAGMGGENSFDAWLAGTSDGSFNMREPDSEKVFNIIEQKSGHIVYGMSNGNSKNLGSNKYKKIRHSIQLPEYQN